MGESEQRLSHDEQNITELAASIHRIGLVNPLSVTPSGDNFKLIAGHRRLEACKTLGISKVACAVFPKEDAKNSEITFAENYFRQDLSPVELACAIQDSINKAILTVPQIAKGFSRSEHWVLRQLAMLQWPDDVLEVIHHDQISVAAASNLALVTDNSYRTFLIRNAVESGATARTTAAWLQAWRSMQPPEEAITAEPVPAGPTLIPAVPQAPCICCSQVYRTDELSHVPVCPNCIRLIREVGMSRS